MRYYPQPDINFYCEIPPGWSIYCRTPQKSWYRRTLQPKHSIAYWRDLNDHRLESIHKKDLHFKDWPTSRIRDAACLPLYYCVGNRFIRLERAFPAGFKCSAMPLNLKEIREHKKYNKQMAKERRAKARQAKKERKLREKLEKAKKKT